jgi:hypothetical protein
MCRILIFETRNFEATCMWSSEDTCMHWNVRLYDVIWLLQPRISSFSPGASGIHHHHHRPVPAGQNSSVVTAASQLPVAAASAPRYSVNPAPSQPQQSAIGVPPIRFNLTNSRLVLEKPNSSQLDIMVHSETEFSFGHERKSWAFIDLVKFASILVQLGQIYLGFHRQYHRPRQNKVRKNVQVNMCDTFIGWNMLPFDVHLFIYLVKYC